MSSNAPPLPLQQEVCEVFLASDPELWRWHNHSSVSPELPHCCDGRTCGSPGAWMDHCLTSRLLSLLPFVIETFMNYRCCLPVMFWCLKDPAAFPQDHQSQNPHEGHNPSQSCIDIYGGSPIIRVSITIWVPKMVSPEMRPTTDANFERTQCFSPRQKHLRILSLGVLRIS